LKGIAGSEDLARSARRGVENRPRWALDVIFREDDCRTPLRLSRFPPRTCACFLNAIALIERTTSQTDATSTTGSGSASMIRRNSRRDPTAKSGRVFMRKKEKEIRRQLISLSIIDL
jgi:hypothetical protein